MPAGERVPLRRALWQTPEGWISSTAWEVCLTADVDLLEARQAAERAMARVPLDAHQVDLLTLDLLPGWYDEWLLAEQDRFHLLRLQALEQVCRTATQLNQYALATRVGLAAVCDEPLRQSAVAALVEAHLEEGNTCEAVRRFDVHRELRMKELGAEPGGEITALVAQAHGALDGTAARHVIPRLDGDGQSRRTGAARRAASEG